ncbi:restriction endonuclease subunit S [Leuconostoc mesenteroides]|uniref:restriction endonuclease subunit S n=2 Tax=Leuconostoc TaxID=1243 RepID=UPI0032E00FD1
MSNKVPRIRFNGYSDAWEQRKLGEESYIKSRIGWQRLTKDEQLVTGDYYLITGTDIDETTHTIDYSRSVYVSKERYEKDANIQVKDGDIIVTKDGTIGKIAMITNLDKPATLNSHLFVLRDLSNKINNRFLLHVLESPEFKKFVEATKTGSTLTGLPQKTFINFKYYYPSLKEQKLIAIFFDNFDNLITLHQRKLDLLKEQKKGYLQKMFPKNGAKVPELRFAGFADDWEERKFKDILKTYSFRSYLANASDNGKYEVIQQGDNPIVGYSDGIPFMNYKDIILFGDHTVSLYKPNSPFFISTDGVKILSADNFEGNYLYTTLERYKPDSQGYKRHFTILKNQELWFTRNMEEQQKVGLFFKQLDNNIALQQKKLSLLKDQKKGLLQKMFI